MIKIQGLHKQYGSGLHALSDVNLHIRQGEIFALLGPNGAGKTTLISTICGLVRPSSGKIQVAGFNVVTQAHEARRRIGLVPQELTVNMFDPVWDTLVFSRGLFGKPRNDAHLESVLRALNLWDKKDARIQTLSGGMKRRVLIAKALAHEPDVLFLDEPTAGVDVELRRSMWRLIEQLRQQGVTIILTTHYIEEAEEIAERIGIINQGRIILTEDKPALMHKLGHKEVVLQLAEPIKQLPEPLREFAVSVSNDGNTLTYTYRDNTADMLSFLARIHASKLPLRDIQTRQSSLEQIFVDLVGESK